MLDIIVFVLFIVAVVSVGMIKSRHEGDSESYFLAGRGLSWWLIGVGLIAANISAEQFVGMSGQAADYLGIAISSYEWMAAITLVVVAFVFLPYFLKTGIYTMPEFLEHRYNHWARSLMALFMMIILIGVSLSGVIYAGALTMRDLLEANGYGVTLAQACWIMGVMAAIYVAFGGLKACAWADLIQGTALVAGGVLILLYALNKLGATPVADLVTGTGAAATGLADTASGWSKMLALNSSKLHMVLPKTDLNIPWTALIVGLWIPNFYYWGLNQYITQRTLGSSSLKEGQKGIVFAAALKLIIPFIIVIPGMIAFNLYSKDMQVRAEKDYLAKFEKLSIAATSTDVFKIPPEWVAAHPAIEAMKDKIAAQNEKAVANAKAVGVEPTEHTPQKYKFDSALGLLIVNLIPQKIGIMGFILAALLGAIISSLAAVLNAASTIFTMDIYGKYLNKNASQKQLVGVGRISVGVFVIIGCLISPLLDNPKFGGIFKYIQEFQGYVTPGILAVFVFGLLNRRAPGVTGVVGLLLNPVLYAIMAFGFPNIAFLDRMAICFGIVLAVMTLIGLAKPLAQPVEFKTNTRLDLSTSKGTLMAGVGVVIATLCLYAFFW